MNNTPNYCPHCHTPLTKTKTGRNRKELEKLEVGCFKKTKWYNSAQASEVLGVSTDTLRKIRASGLLKFHIERISKRATYLGNDLEAYYTRRSII